MSDNKVRPYAAVGNVKDLLHRFRHRNLPETIGQETLRVAGVPEGMIGRTLATFRFLGLLTEANEPTDEWRALSDVDDDAYPEMLERIVRAAYADTFIEIDPAIDPQERIRAAFQRFQPKSQLDRMVSLFLALCAEAGIPTRDVPKRRSTKSQQLDEAKGRRVPAVRPPQGRQGFVPPPVKPFTPAVTGESKTINLRGGGTLMLHASATFFQLPREDRDFVFRLLDELADYENQRLLTGPKDDA